MHVPFLLNCAQELYRERENKLLSSSKVCEVQNPKEETFFVRKINQSKLFPYFERVDLKNKSCTCGVYQQTGVPCEDAIVCLQYLKKSSIEVGKNYYHDFCFASRWKESYQCSDIFAKIPTMDEVNQEYLKSMHSSVQLECPIEVVTKQTKTKKRF